MTEQTKRVKLSISQQIDNFMFRFTPIAMVFIASGWTLILWFKAYSRWHKKHPSDWFRPEFPKVLTVVSIGFQHDHVKRLLSQGYHVNYLFINYEWRIIQNTICMEGQYMVAKNMYDKVDSILYHSGIQSQLWHCEHQPGNLRHVEFKPHTQAQKQAPTKHQVQPVKAKLGRTYQ